MENKLPVKKLKYNSYVFNILRLKSWSTQGNPDVPLCIVVQLIESLFTTQKTTMFCEGQNRSQLNTHTYNVGNKRRPRLVRIFAKIKIMMKLHKTK